MKARILRGLSGVVHLLPCLSYGHVEGELGWIEKEVKKVGAKFDYHGSRQHSRCYEPPLKHTQMAFGSSTGLNIQYKESNYGNQN